MDSSHPSNQRAHYRLRYPRAERPMLRIEHHGYEVIEISEGGAKILLTDSTAITDHQSFSGELRFSNRETVGVQGVVLRCREGEAALVFDGGVSLRLITDEQRRLRKKYPVFFDALQSEKNPKA